MFCRHVCVLIPNVVPTQPLKPPHLLIPREVPCPVISSIPQKIVSVETVAQCMHETQGLFDRWSGPYDTYAQIRFFTLCF